MSERKPDTVETVQALRRQMPVTEKWAYFDHAAASPLTKPAYDRLLKYADEVTSSGDVMWPQWCAELERLRDAAAGLVGADPQEIALVTSTTAGINFVAEGLDWRDGDNVVTLADEFPSNVYPWMHQKSKGVETRLLETQNGRIDYDKLEALVDERTRVLSVSWVGFQTGYRQDVDKLCELAHRKGALFFLDAIQALGVFPIDVRKTPIDFFSADGHKWLLGPEGAGVAYIRREHLDRLRPPGVGWNSVVHATDYTRLELALKPSAARHEVGSPNMAGMLPFGKSLDLLAGIGPAALAAAILDITDRACERLESAGARVHTDRDLSHRGGEQRSGIVFFELPGRDPVEFRKRCQAAGIVLSCRAGKLRISPHAYNTEEDLDRLIELVRD